MNGSRDVALSALGQKRTFAAQKGMSALPPKADVRRRRSNESAKGQERTSNVRRSRLDMAEFKNKRPPQLAASINGQKSKFANTTDP